MTRTEMTRTDLLRAELLTQRRWLKARGHEEREAIRAEGEAGVVVDEAEASVLDVQTDLECALLEIRTEAIRNIDRALARLTAGTYGICVDCDREISMARLRALPFAEQCVNCAAHDEATRREQRSVEPAALAATPLETGDDAAA